MPDDVVQLLGDAGALGPHRGLLDAGAFCPELGGQPGELVVLVPQMADQPTGEHRCDDHEHASDGGIGGLGPQEGPDHGGDRGVGGGQGDGAALVSLSPAANAASSQTVMIRPGQFVAALSDTRSAGHVDFLKDGLHVWTDDATTNAKAAEYFAVPAQGLPSSASLTWYGTSPQPGSQLVFDADGDPTTTGDAYNLLVGEPVYGNDYWMTSGSSFYKQHHDLCPQTSGGSGSDCHGTLAEWQAVLPNARLYAAGFSLGSGIQGDGVIHDIQVGDTDYQFTNEAPAPDVTIVPVTGTVTATRTDYRAATTCGSTSPPTRWAPTRSRARG